jgi:hypothetical protein
MIHCVLTHSEWQDKLSPSTFQIIFIIEETTNLIFCLNTVEFIFASF